MKVGGYKVYFCVYVMVKSNFFQQIGMVRKESYFLYVNMGNFLNSDRERGADW